ncbi:MAG: regulatory protein RecX [Acidobacteriota bacterium]
MTFRRRSRDAAPPPAPQTLWGAALRLLGRRDFTTHELTERLRQRGYVASDIEPAIVRLLAERLLDDARVAKAHVRTASRIKGRGRLRIERELQARGVPGSVARDALSDLAPDDELALIRRFVTRKHITATASPDERRRLFQQLLRRGFRSDAIARALRAPDDEGE